MTDNSARADFARDVHLAVQASRSFEHSCDAVFAAWTDERNFFVLRASAVSHEIIEIHAAGGHRCRQVHQVGSRRVEIESDVVESIPGVREVSVGTSPTSQSRETLSFEARGAACRVTVRHEVVWRRRPSWLVRPLYARSYRRQIRAGLAILATLLSTSRSDA